MSLNAAQQATLQALFGSSNVTGVDGGHMSYDRLIAQTDSGPVFIKAYDQAMFTDPVRSDDAKRHLEKEAAMYRYLQAHGFTAVPRYYGLSDDMLLLEALPSSAGWEWKMPRSAAERQDYSKDILLALEQLAGLPMPPENIEPRRSVDIFHDDGWKQIPTHTADSLLNAGLERWGNKLHPETLHAAERLRGGTESLRTPRPDAKHMNHHDLRQANIAWHPKHGVRLVDWSWADAGPVQGDTTMFLIDLKKSGIPITPAMREAFDPAFAALLFGYWLRRSAEPHREGNEIVRLHQLVSAVSAFELIEETMR